MAPPARRTTGTESSRKVLHTLLAFSEQRPTATAEDLAREVGVPLSSAYRYISLLREVGLIEEGRERTYHLSARIIPLARVALLGHLPRGQREVVIRDILPGKVAIDQCERHVANALEGAGQYLFALSLQRRVMQRVHRVAAQSYGFTDPQEHLLSLFESKG